MLTGGEITAMAYVLIVTGGLVSITGIIVHAVAKVKIARLQHGLEDGAGVRETEEGADDGRAD